jgi:hypothetical protein
MEGDCFDELTGAEMFAFEAIGSVVVVPFLDILESEFKLPKEAKTTFSLPRSAAPIDGFSAVMEPIAPEPCLTPPIKNLTAMKFIAKLTRRNKNKLRLPPSNAAVASFVLK